MRQEVVVGLVIGYLVTGILVATWTFWRYDWASRIGTTSGELMGLWMVMIVGGWPVAVLSQIPIVIGVKLHNRAIEKKRQRAAEEAAAKRGRDGDRYGY